jgi:hypothetical protein
VRAPNGNLERTQLHSCKGRLVGNDGSFHVTMCLGASITKNAHDLLPSGTTLTEALGQVKLLGRVGISKAGARDQSILGRRGSKQVSDASISFPCSRRSREIQNSGWRSGRRSPTPPSLSVFETGRFRPSKPESYAIAAHTECSRIGASMYNWGHSHRRDSFQRSGRRTHRPTIGHPE